MNEEKLQKIRHSLSHLMSMAVQELYPQVGLGVGPAVENGFYQDYDLPTGQAGLPETITPEILPKLEKRIRELIKENIEFKQHDMDFDEAYKLYKHDPYKTWFIDDLKERGEKLSFYKSGWFDNLCGGPHVDSTKEIDPDAFKLTHIAGAYWHGDEKEKMLTRIYGVAFESKEELEKYLEMIEEAKKRDHRKLGKELGLFTVSELVGKGLPMLMPKGNVIRTELEKMIFSKKQALNYSFVTIPHIARKELYIKSGHMGKYDAMMPVMKDENGDEFVMKAMNCPHHFEIYNAEPHSYKDLPYRIAENTAVYRNEKGGELSGLLRVKNITQDDTHHFITEDQIESEIEMIFGLMREVYEIFDFTNYKVEISIRDKKNKDKYFGKDEIWEKAEAILEKSVKKWGVNFEIKEGEAAFYGPKIDIKVKDSIGREWQLTTIQLDFNQPENFEMDYTGEDGKKHRVVVLHVAILGSFERFMGVIIEHYAGAFPVWLSPVQVCVLPISEKHHDYAKEIFDTLKKEGVRVELKDEAESLGKKIRNAKIEKVPYLIVIGDKELDSKTLTIEGRNDEKMESVKIDEFIKLIKEKVENKN
ncbi:MAG: threonine--tRNA ligase [Candidatus Paceibacterota bacterium]|jgi:threonyl-tRNA synthetase